MSSGSKDEIVSCSLVVSDSIASNSTTGYAHASFTPNAFPFHWKSKAEPEKRISHISLSGFSSGNASSFLQEKKSNSIPTDKHFKTVLIFFQLKVNKISSQWEQMDIHCNTSHQNYNNPIGT